MTTEADPQVGQWYEHLDKGQTFEVVALDEGAASVQIQYFDGDLDQLGVEEWHELNLASAAEPEDWTGPVEVEHDDLGYAASTEMDEDAWREPLRTAHRRVRDLNREQFGEEPTDEWGDGRPEEEPWDGED